MLEFNPDGSIKVPVITQQLGDVENQIDIEKSRDIAKSIFEEFKNKGGVFSKVHFPEEITMPKGMERGSEEHLRYMTLTVVLSVMREAEKLHKMTYNIYMNPQTKWVLDPENVINHREEELEDVFAELKDKWPRKDADIWFRICLNLKGFDYKLSNLLKNFNFDALKISDYIEDNKSLYPNLGGLKIKPLWLRIVDETAGVKLSNMDKIPIPIDIHTARLSYKILFNQNLNSKINKKIIERCQNGWIIVLENTEIYPCQLDEPLWLMGKYKLFDKFMNEHKFLLDR